LPDWIDFTEDYRDILTALVAEHARFLIIGAMRSQRTDTAAVRDNDRMQIRG
jgi:hypothetical protein